MSNYGVLKTELKKLKDLTILISKSCGEHSELNKLIRGILEKQGSELINGYYREVGDYRELSEKAAQSFVGDSTVTRDEYKAAMAKRSLLGKTKIDKNVLNHELVYSHISESVLGSSYVDINANPIDTKGSVQLIDINSHMDLEIEHLLRSSSTGGCRALMYRGETQQQSRVDYYAIHDVRVNLKYRNNNVLDVFSEASKAARKLMCHIKQPNFVHMVMLDSSEVAAMQHLFANGNLIEEMIHSLGETNLMNDLRKAYLKSKSIATLVKDGELPAALRDHKIC